MSALQLTRVSPRRRTAPHDLADVLGADQGGCVHRGLLSDFRRSRIDVTAVRRACWATMTHPEVGSTVVLSMPDKQTMRFRVVEINSDGSYSVVPHQQAMNTPATRAILLGLIFALILMLAAVFVAEVLWPAALAGGLLAVAIMTFGGVYLGTRRFRHALAVSLFLVYIATVGLLVTPLGQAVINQQLQQAFGSLTPLVGTVIAFYFGADSAERIGTQKNPTARTTPDDLS